MRVLGPKRVRWSLDESVRVTNFLVVPWTGEVTLEVRQRKEDSGC